MFDKILTGMILLFLPFTVVVITLELHGLWLIFYCMVMGFIAIGCEIYDSVSMDEDDYK